MTSSYERSATREAVASTAHETLVFERSFRTSAEKVFGAYADVAVRVKWSAPSETAAVVYSSHDFRIDGLDRFRCGAKDKLEFEGVVSYVEIAAPWRIVYTELISKGHVRLAVSLVTWELTETATGTQLVVTDQIASLVGAEMIDGSRVGMEAALDNLCERLEK